MKHLRHLFLAFLLLFISAAAMAQTRNDNTEKNTTEWAARADVNGDGVVNEADIAEILAIMKENNKTKYYWYAGWTEPTEANIGEIINEEYPVSSTNTTMNKAGGSTTVITGYTKNNPLYLYDANLYNSTAKTNYYLVLPNGIGVWDSEGIATLLDTFDLQDNIVIPNHKVYKSQSTTRNIRGLMLF